MLLAMNVLKNSEEIHEENLKADSYTRILKNSISYVVLYKMICEEIINHFEEFPKERVEELENMGCVFQMNYDSLQGSWFQKETRWC
jgi:hypothetical protein